MNNLAEYVASHPRTVGIIFAFFCGIAGYNCFKAGMITAVIRGDYARDASEALGG